MKISNQNRKLKLKNIIFIVLIFVVLIVVLYLFVFNNVHFISKRSIHDDAKTYKTKTCLVFYPATKDGKTYAKELCENVSEEAIFDYALIKYGDYNLVEYGNGIHYFIDDNNKPLEITSISEDGKGVLSDYLRYDMKKAEIDEAYTLSFLEKTSIDNLDISKCTYSIQDENVLIYYPDFDFTSSIPLKYIKEYANIDLGYKNVKYVKPTYVSTKRKIVALTFDDGPSLSTSPELIKTLYKYDSVATFFVLGQNLDNKTIEVVKDSIEKGNQYGSHSQDHPNFKYISSDEVYRQIMEPVNDLYSGFHGGTDYDFDGLEYTVTVYRAPYGSHNAAVDEVAPYIAISWNCDPEDWSSRDKDKILESIRAFGLKKENEYDKQIILCHDIYSSTIEAMKVLIPELIDKGYQLVTIDELLNVLNINKTNTDAYPW